MQPDTTCTSSRDRAVTVAVWVDHVLAKAGIVHLVESTADLRTTDDESNADVAVTDLDAPSRVALEVERRRGTDAPRPAIVALTATSSAERISDGVKAGIAGFVAVQSPADELLRAIRFSACGDMYFDPRIAAVVVSRLRQSANAVSIDERHLRYDELSEREQSVFRLVAEGYTGLEIGRTLGITANAVDTYRHRIQEKMGLMHRRDYIRFALGIGVLAR